MFMVRGELGRRPATFPHPDSRVIDNDEAVFVDLDPVSEASGLD